LFEIENNTKFFVIIDNYPSIIKIAFHRVYIYTAFMNKILYILRYNKQLDDYQNKYYYKLT